MPESVYIETTIVSYLAARPSPHLQVAAHQQMTFEWWTTRRRDFECFVSPIVLEEAGAGDPEAAAAREKYFRGFPILNVTDECEELATEILNQGALPQRAVRDAAHVAVAACHGMGFLLTWNCRPLANAQIVRQLGSICNRSGFGMPVICTPEELMGD